MTQTDLGHKPINILLIEDNPIDAKLMTKAFEKAKITTQMEVVENGVEAIQFLKQELKYSDKKRPDIIILDLNLPLKDGREVLAEVKQDESLRRIPVVILSSSEDEQDIMKSYQHQANCYITKPVTLDGLVRVVQTINEFWRSTARLPPS